LPPPDIGSPCQTKADCGDYECTGAWCSPPSCTNDATCGATSAGNANQCIENGLGTKICFPGCKSNSDCASFKETSCQPARDGSSGMVCSTYTVGTPCNDNAHCGNGDWICAGRPGWCTPSSCIDDSDCNILPASPANKCIENAASTKVCFPGCSTTSECLVYGDNTVCNEGFCTKT
jgi:hypothetical protein